jgi:MFS transporter, PAT family, beta-lactamase induction signal transducer AmpG
MFNKTKNINLLNSKSGRFFAAFVFYFAEGAPIGFIWWALPSLLKRNGVGIDNISALTAALTLPWVFKFLWAPLVDVFRNSKYGFKFWIGWAQVGMCLSLLPLLVIPLSNNLGIWGVCLFLHSFFAATQDVSVDALMINTVTHDEKGEINGFMQAGMLVGRGLFGGGALMVASHFGLPFTLALMMLIIFSALLLLLFIKEPHFIKNEKTGLSSFTHSLKQTFLNSQTLLALGFALTAAAASEAAGAMTGPFLTDKLINLEVIGFFFAVPVILAMIVGGLVGGFLSDKLRRKNSIYFFLTGLVAMVLLISVTNYFVGNISQYIWLSFFTGMYFFVGMFTTSSYALFMDVTNPKLGATQFSTFMAATNACEAWVVFVAGGLVLSQGYSFAFISMCVVSVLSFFFLARLKSD